MNRRNFFNKLGAAVLGTYLAVQVKPLKLLTVREPEYIQMFSWVNEDGKLYKEITKTLSMQSPWVDLLKDKVWEPNMGETTRRLS
jgi:hypothetical protein